MIKVNLVPSDILAKAHQKQQVLQAAAVGVGLLLVVAGISAGHWFKLNRLEKTLAEDQARLKKLEVIVAQVEELERTASAVRSRLRVITDLLRGRTVYPYFMSDFVRSVPPGVHVKSVTSTGGGSAAGPIKLNMTAEARTNEDIAAWVKKMEDSGRFTDIELGAVTQDAGAERSFNFTIKSTYNPTL